MVLNNRDLDIELEGIRLAFKRMDEAHMKEIDKLKTRCDGLQGQLDALNRKSGRL